MEKWKNRKIKIQRDFYFKPNRKLQQNNNTYKKWMDKL
jgi:hypothetical protein